MCMSKPRTPRPAPPPAPPPTQVDASVQKRYSDEMRRRKLSANETIATSGAGVAQPASTGKTVLGG